MELIKIFALLYLAVYYGILLGGRTYLLYRRTGVNAIRNMKRTGLEGFIERVFMVCFVSVSVIVLNFVFLKNNYQWLVPISYLEHGLIQNVGMVVSMAGLFIAVLAQLQMGDSWRLGLDANTQTKLITNGLYRISRNPIYLGILISYSGFFLMMPNALSFGFLMVSYCAFEVKVRLEEQYLEKIKMPMYTEFRNNVRRWL